MNLQDAIYELLGVPPEEQPADYYRLLGLARFEANPEVITNAASRQMLFVRQLAAGPYSQVSQDMLDLLAEAKVCLLNTDRRRAYDVELRRLMNRSTSSAGGAAASDTDGDSFQRKSSLLDSVIVDPTSSLHLPSFMPPLEDQSSVTSAINLPALKKSTQKNPTQKNPTQKSNSRQTSPSRRAQAPATASEADSVNGFSTAIPTGKRREWVVGADPKCDVVVRCPYVSRRHCRIIEAGGNYWVEDLGSRNGTHVNHQPVETRMMVSGNDLVTLGTLARMPWPPEVEAHSAGPRSKESGHEVMIVRVGRSASNDIVLNHSSVSRRHAQLTVFNDHALLEDLGSTNGTFVGDSALRVNRRRVNASDIVRIGRYSLPVSDLLRTPSVA